MRKEGWIEAEYCNPCGTCFPAAYHMISDDAAIRCDRVTALQDVYDPDCGDLKAGESFVPCEGALFDVNLDDGSWLAPHRWLEEEPIAPGEDS